MAKQDRADQADQQELAQRAADTTAKRVMPAGAGNTITDEQLAAQVGDANVEEVKKLGLAFALGQKLAAGAAAPHKTPGLDESKVPGGRYLVDGRWVNSQGRDVDEEGNLVDGSGNKIDEHGRPLATLQAARYAPRPIPGSDGLYQDTNGAIVDEAGRWVDVNGRPSTGPVPVTQLNRAPAANAPR